MLFDTRKRQMVHCSTKTDSNAKPKPDNENICFGLPHFSSDGISYDLYVTSYNKTNSLFIVTRKLIVKIW